MAQDTAAYDTVLKNYYEGGIRDLIPTKVPALEMFERLNANEWGGRFVEYPIRVGRNEGTGYASELGTLPAAGRQQYADVRIQMRYGYGRATFSKQVMQASQGAKAAFAPAMRSEMDGLVKDIANNRGRLIFGDGRGILALENGTSAAALPVDSPGNVAGATNGGRFFNAGMIVALVVPATGALRSGSVQTVLSVNSTGTTVTLDGDPTGTDNDYIVRCAQTDTTNVSDTSYAKEPVGLLGLVDDGTYLTTLSNINRTTYPQFSSNVIATVGALSADVFQRGIDIADQVGDGDVTDLWMHHSVRRAYINVDTDMRRYMGQDLSKMDLGTQAAKREKLYFGGIPISVDRYCPYGMIFGVDRSGLRRYVEIEGQWMDDDGSVLRPVGTGATLTDSWECVYRYWDNFHNEYPNRSFRLDGVSAVVTVAHVY